LNYGRMAALLKRHIIIAGCIGKVKGKMRFTPGIFACFPLLILWGG